MTALTEGGITWRFVYDAQDLRAHDDALGTETYGAAFVYDAQGTVRGTYDTQGVRLTSYVAGFGFGEVLAQVDGSGVATYSLRDRLGTTVGWTDAGGAVSSLTARDSYGVRALPPAGVVPFGYTGHAEGRWCMNKARPVLQRSEPLTHAAQPSSASPTPSSC